MSGTVTDSSGAAVAGATVTATQTNTGRTLVTVTTEAGLYAFPNLDVGPYTLSVEKAGFRKYSHANIVISISTKTVVDAALEIGDVAESVMVTAAAPLLQSASSEVGTSFSPKLFREAPIYAGGLRNPEAFIGFQAGVVNGAGAEGGISGGARRSKEILIDGANATNPESGGVAFNGLPSVEALGEFKRPVPRRAVTITTAIRRATTPLQRMYCPEKRASSTRTIPTFSTSWRLGICPSGGANDS